MQVRLSTNLGDILVALEPEKAPATTENFLTYVRDGFYDGTIFHRVIPGFVVQGGGLDRDLRPRATRPPVTNEADNGLTNTRGTLSMARTSEPHSATSQFFINVQDNPALDHRDRSPMGWGYCVFGRVVEGMDVVERIRNLPTTNRGGHQDVPAEDAVIEHAEVVEEQGASG
jgi:peptidyl-prolyl cis-trans isomerase B (cyclophilin B)